MKKAIWLSYDIGVRGDYEALYSWLDGKGAIECGDSLAFFIFEAEGDFLGALKKELAETLDIAKRMRFYVVYRDTSTNKVKGNFLFGARKAPPWAGHAMPAESAVEDES